MTAGTNREILLAGAAAAFTVDLLVYPLDTIKTRVQCGDYITKDASSVAKTSRTVALRGLYQGVGSVILATLPAGNWGVFTVYEGGKSVLGSHRPRFVPEAAAHSLASGIAELASCLILTPAEVIKQNAQMLNQSSGSSAPRRSASIEAFRMLRSSEQGAARRLWSGYTALAARNLPFTVLQFPIFEGLRAEIIKRRGAGRGSEADRGLWEVGLVNGLSAATAGSIAATATTPTDVVKTRMMVLGGGEDKSGGKGATTKNTAGKRPKQLSGYQVAKQVYRERE
ncbi:unnamed protein product [Parascedosporium putredinis]|uniref:Mitochondrial carrier n=1 Tax=Parascedosporium putredinis TaxID=1442378 RepID=A0A9P1M7C1_9PEZI|nr:unnamed protein product [Parascedosporium putredinis]CAI7990186.1 unnamed protein product [Parascedosporium putredinis]